MNNLKNICKEPIYKSLFLEWSRPIRNFIYSKCGDTALSNDIAQDVFLTLWQKCKDVPFEKAKSFLFTSANNKLIDQFRHKKVVLNHQKVLGISKINKETPIYELEVQEAKEKLEKIINSIPEKSRVVFLMSRIEKVSYKEIAERLDLSVKAVEKRMQGALEIMRANYKRKI